MLRLIDRLLAERVEVEASTKDRLAAADVHILCIDDVVARASDIFEYSSYSAAERDSSDAIVLGRDLYI